MHLHLRPEEPADHRAVEELTYQAFERMPELPREYCEEHCLVHKLRRVPGFVPALDYVAEWDGQLAGHILYTVSQVLTPDGEAVETLTFGPVSVRPAYQNRGIGGALIRHTLGQAREMGYRAVIIVGHPAYYPRFGFCSARQFGITMMDGNSIDALMVLELFSGALAGVQGRYRYDPAFALTRAEVAAFNREYGYPAIETV